METFKHPTLRKIYSKRCFWCGMDFDTIFSQTKFCGVTCKHQHDDAKTMGTMESSRAAAHKALARWESAKELTAAKVEAIFGNIFHLEWAP